MEENVGGLGDLAIREGSDSYGGVVPSLRQEALRDHLGVFRIGQGAANLRPIKPPTAIVGEASRGSRGTKDWERISQLGGSR